MRAVRPSWPADRILRGLPSFAPCALLAESCPGLVAVGTAIADRPPHRSRRALLTHRAPPSGSGVETVTWQWMQYPDRREEAVGFRVSIHPDRGGTKLWMRDEVTGDPLQVIIFVQRCAEAFGLT